MGLEKEKPAGLDFGPNMRRSSLQNEETDDGVECNKNKMGSVLLEAENTRGLVLFCGNSVLVVCLMEIVELDVLTPYQCLQVVSVSLLTRLE
ncbi:hypothetical protein V6N12_065827 [Hibiscus sabdariffa]|uniref:Uncharacterized protein n=1 Tax=Hibiscus sabdariffa TaxID=183260 RepID=A0ABR2G9U4_9ROSI